MASRPGRLWLGTSGYQYDQWRAVFYPEGSKPAAWLPYYAGHVNTVEINNTFYRLPRAEVFTAWRAQVLPGFRFALKFSRFGSHMKKLKDPAETIGLHVERAAALGRRLGPILVQLPPPSTTTGAATPSATPWTSAPCWRRRHSSPPATVIDGGRAAPLQSGSFPAAVPGSGGSEP